jgi:two-component system sensor histidine kinase PilS (NtrC family)
MLVLHGKEAARGLKWITLIRLIAYTFLPIVSLGFLWKFQPPMALLPLIGLIALVLLISVGQLLSKKHWYPLFKGSPLSWVPDLIIITGILHYTGGPVSDFWFLYVLVIVIGGLSYGTKGAFLAAGVSSAVYATLMYLSFKNILSLVLPPDPIMQKADWPATIGLRMFLHIAFFLLTAAITSYVAARYRSKSGELEVKTSELHQLRLDTDIILETIPSGILACDFSGNILYFNRSGMEILGLPSHLLTQGLSIHALLESRPIFYRVVSRCFKGDLPSRTVELSLPMSNGSNRPIAVDASYLLDRKGGQRGLVIYFNDLTEAKAMEREIRVSDRLSAVGQLARDLAHEIRNPLAVIRGSVEFMSRELAPGKHMARLMDGVLRESDRLNTLIYEFLEFSRLQPPECTPVSAKNILESLHKLPTLSSRIEFTESSAPAHCWVDRDQFIKALDVLIRDTTRHWETAVHASISVTEPGKPLEAWPGERVPIPPNYIGFVIRFPEHVLPESDVDDLFLPFRHTDAKHRGLGLCTSHRIVESHNGEIKVINLPAYGLALVVFVPLAHPGEDKPPPSSHQTATMEGAAA